jgi:catechol 2,3-dioxygenase-like lactoylglutathione lyase family enzyme
VTAPEIHDARPVSLVRDIDATLSYYRDQLGFNAVASGDPPNFASPVAGARPSSTTRHTASESSERKTPMATTSPSVSRSADVADGGSHVYGEDLPYLVGDRG